MKSKFGFVLVAFLVAASVDVGVRVYEPEFSAQLAVSQFSDATGYQQTRLWTELRSYVDVGYLFVLVMGVCLYWKEIRKFFGEYLALFLLPMVFLVSGCRPYDVPEFHEIETSHTAFLVPLEGNTEEQSAFNSEEYLRNKMVAAKRVQIPHKWVQTGRLPITGDWVPTVRLITVDRAPVTREWSADRNTGTSNNNQAIWVESQDSVGFSTGITCTARIPNEESAIQFLFNYPHGSLERVMDLEIRGRIQKIMAREAAREPMDTLREKKNEMLDAVEQDVIPFFEARGILVTTIGQFGGFTYENPDIQKAIDEVFAAQQDEEVAKAEAKAAEQRKLALQLRGEGEAAQILESRRGEAEGIKLVADAKAYEIEKANADLKTYLSLKQLEIEQSRLEKWDGRYPVYLFTGEGQQMPQILLGMPTDLTSE
ncbi:MAG: hypothetical protein R3C18_18410 [Planctomycetaceae bacterium]